jgi:phosphoribosylaminoimidazolecarboxamide formyltransferase / IMP cyclohydrolase
MGIDSRLERNRRALLSVTDKTDLDTVATVLNSFDYELFASGGTYQYLLDHGFEANEVSGLTKFPEIFGGRVKTLHPAVFGGILGAEEADFADVKKLGIEPFDVVVVNLYDFADALASGADEAAMVEKIDIGGPSLLRAAAKNFKRVCVLSDPESYEEFVFECRANEGLPSLDFRQRMAAQTFGLVAEYDNLIAEWFHRDAEAEYKLLELRYGENPHQSAEIVVPSGEDEEPLSGMGLRIWNGKQLSYNNLVDAIAALKLIIDLGGTSCVAMKHTNPCGVGQGPSDIEALESALICDPESAFGGIFAFSCAVDAGAAEILRKRFCEVVLAPEFTAEALELLRKKKNLRVLTYDGELFSQATRGQSKSFGNVTLQQDEDDGFPELDEWQHVAGPAPDARTTEGLIFNWKICKHVKSNAIVLGNDTATLGIGAGQMSRVDSTRIAVRKAGDQKLDLKGSICASDAFFPFADSIERLNEAGIAAIIAPGGSIRDEEVIAAADKLGITLVHVNRRHFRH